MQDVATNLPVMTNREDLPETVNVPVADLELIATVLKAYGSDEALELTRSHIPKPKPRLVAVPDNFRDWHEQPNQTSEEYLAAQPDLLALLDEAMESVTERWTVNYTDSRSLSSDLKARIRTALGVTE